MTFPDLETLFLSPTDSLEAAMKVFNDHAVRTDAGGFALVVDADRRLLGVVTDGDVRRGLLTGLSIDAFVSMVMSKEPTVARLGATAHQLLRLFDRRVRHVPVMDNEGRVKDLLLYSQFHVAGNRGPVAVRAKAPLRISFAGGGVDLTPYFGRQPCAVISATIDRYCHGTLVKRTDNRIIICSEDYRETLEAESIKGLVYNGTLDLLKAVIKLLDPEFGFELTTWSDAPPGSGLGSSAVMAVVVIALFNELAENRMTERQITDLAYQAERIELGIPGGWQDQCAAAFGGLNYIEFTEDDIIVHPLSLKERVLNELEESLLLCFTGRTRDSGALHRVHAKGVEPPGYGEELFRLATQVKNALIRGQLTDLGALLDEAWHSKKRVASVTNEYIDRLYDAGRRAGALGGKLLGAGQGGYLLFYCPPLARCHVAQALEVLGTQSTAVNFDFRGLRTWRLLEEEPRTTAPAVSTSTCEIGSPPSLSAI